MGLHPYEDYLKAINGAYLNGDATEHTHRPALKALIEAAGDNILCTNEPKRLIHCGAPDMKVSRQVGHTTQAFGYIECKDIGVDLRREEKSDQLKRYLRAIDTLILTDYITFRLYRGGQLEATATLAKESKGGRFVASADSLKETQTLFALFYAAEPVYVKNAKELAERMAGIAKLLRGVIATTFGKEDAHGALHGQYEAFKRVLLHDLTPDEFSDMYAQTICYGLFAARCHVNDQTIWGKDVYAAHHGVDGKRGEFTREKAAYLLPKTNPFLRNIFGDIAGVGMDERIAWLVDDLVALLRNAAMDKVLRGFGTVTERTDPVVHFYETFLAAYDPELRESRGVYYTPEPVVSYIVRSVDGLLKDTFGLKKGLADKSKIKVQKLKSKNAEAPSAGCSDTPSPLRGTPPLQGENFMHRCLILDPAVGTGTFLYAVIAQIRKTIRDAGAWNAYVKAHLLPRLFGFELMMAPYAVCHMKLGLELAETGYDFASDERLGVYLTNTLEEADDMSGLPLFTQWLAEEARAANRVKRDLPIMVVLGNPPYSGHSSNTGDWIKSLVRDYYTVDGRPLGEKNPKWLQDDYVKFIRYGQHRIEQTGSGILAFISNHGYLDNPTFRGMRQSLMQTFSTIYLLDLHGNTKKKETCPDGSPDKNVFDIQQGVSIGIFVKEPNKKGAAAVYHADLWGDRKDKYDWLNTHSAQKTKWTTVKPEKPFYLFSPQDIELTKEYQSFWNISDVMMKNSVGIVTSRDDFVFSFDKIMLEQRIKDLLNENISVEEIKSKYKLRDSKSWSVKQSREAARITNTLSSSITKCLYRPFDSRYLLYHGNFIERSRSEIMSQMLSGSNIGISIGRAGQVIDQGEWNIVYCSRFMTEFNLFRRGGNNLFPLYLYPTEGKRDLFEDGGPWPAGVDGRVPNLDKGFVEALAERTGLAFVSEGRGDFLNSSPPFQGGVAAGRGVCENTPSPLRGTPPLQGESLTGTFGPEDVLAWIYGVFHSPSYRSRYAAFLKIDFPRVPPPTDAQQFAQVCGIGHALMGLHLMESPILDAGDRQPRFPVAGDNVVEAGYPKYEGGKVFINPTQYFEPVDQAVWDFMIGGYQVCNKWLKDRRGRVLGYDDLEHYKKICVALAETIRLMADDRLDIDY